MLARPTRWVCDPYDVAGRGALAAGLGCRARRRVLARRGFATVEDARAFLTADERHDPLDLPGAAAACRLILAHVAARLADRRARRLRRRRRLLDRDLRALRALGARPVWELPSRFDEGYGLSSGAVERLAERGASLLVTVDCGDHRRRGGGRRAGGRARRGGHRPPPAGRQLPDCPVVHPALGGLPVPRAVRDGRRLKLGEAARPRRDRGRGATSTWSRSRRCATWCRCAARTAARARGDGRDRPHPQAGPAGADGVAGGRARPS